MLYLKPHDESQSPIVSPLTQGRIRGKILEGCKISEEVKFLMTRFYKIMTIFKLLEGV